MDTIGVHTPKMTKIILDQFNVNTTLEWIDSSYINDAVDSIWNEENDLTIYLPVSVEQDPTPSLELVIGEREMNERYNNFDDITELYKFINEQKYK